MKKEQEEQENKKLDIEDFSQYKIENLGKNFNKELITYKVILLGLRGVGKTSISFHLIDNEFIQSSPTISLDLANYQVKVNDKIIQIQLWDTCGNEEFAEKTQNLFVNTKLAILVYALNDRKSFEDIKKWYNILRNRTMGFMTFLIANKKDLEEERQVQEYEGEMLKNEYGFNYFLETSAKSGFNITQLLEKIAIFIYEDEKDKEVPIRHSVTLNKEDLRQNNEISDDNNNNNNKNKKKKKNCC